MKSLLFVFAAIAAAVAPASGDVVLGDLPPPPPGHAIKIENIGGKLRVTAYKMAEPGTVNAAAKPAAKPPSTPATARKRRGGDAAAEESLDAQIPAINLDRPMTAAPAFTALDVAPETISRPESVRDFAAALLNGFDRDGRLQNGFAVEVAPFRPFMGDVSLERYQASWGTRVLYNTGLSLGTTKAAEDEKEVRLALGVQATLIDTQEEKIIAALVKEANAKKYDLPEITPDNIDAAYAAQGDLNAAYLEARNAILARAYTGFKLSAAFAPTWVSDTGKASDFTWDGSSTWLTGSWQWYSNHRWVNQFELLGHLRYRQGEQVVDPADEKRVAEQDTLLAAAGLRLGNDDWHILVEAAYLRIFDGLEGDGDGFRIGGGFERRIGENLWFVLQAGHDFAGGDSQEDFYAIGALRLGSADSPIYTRK